MKKKLMDFLNDEELELRERLFRIILLIGTVVSVVAILAGFVLDNSLYTTIPLCVLLLVMGAAMVATFRYRRMELSAVLIAVLIASVIFPIMFFISGGIEGGATVWFVLGILYIFLMFSGRHLVFLLIWIAVTYIITYTVAYWHPEWIASLGTKAEVYYDSIFGVLAVGITGGCMLRIQIQLYEKEREANLAQKKELARVGKTKDTFFANISHEIRTPINTIIGLNEMILREDISEEVAEDAVNIQNASRMLLSLVNDILDISAIENKQMEIVPAAYSTKDMFGDVVNIIRVRMKEKNLKFIIDIDRKLPAMLLGDEKRIKQIVLNLLTNAVKYTEKGSVTLCVNGEPIDAGRIRLEISVADTGVGIRKTDLDSLYDSFKRVNLESNNNIEGSGLGLSIVKQLVELMGGEITVDSIYRKGSLFKVAIEQKIVDAAPVGMLEYIGGNGGGKREIYRQSFEAPEARILIVDDNEMNLMVARKLLHATKVQVDTAMSGDECLKRTKNKFYHVILMDYMMPEFDGKETLNAIRRQENGMCRDAPVIALTADEQGRAETTYLGYGFDGYLLKPVDGNKLEAEILKFLPEEIIEYRREMEEQDTDNAVQKLLMHKRRKIAITSDCVCDLSAELQKKYDIRLIYQYIETDSGSFCDTREIDADNLSRYLSDSGSRATVVSAPVEEYEAFYAEALTEADEVIHISLAKNEGKSYEHAVLAAQGFGRVHVIDSGHISCGEALMVLSAAWLVQQGRTASEICEELVKTRERIESSFLLPTAGIFYDHGYTNRVTAAICETLQLHPVLRMCKGTLKICGGRTGKSNLARKRYIRRELFWKKNINRDIVYITHAGCTLEEQREVVAEVQRCVPFKRVILQKASASDACNAGFGSIGISYYMKEKGHRTKREKPANKKSSVF